MSIYFWILLLQFSTSSDWHGEHNHAYSISYLFATDKPIKEMRDFYMDMPRFAAAHPLIDSVNCVSTGDFCYQYRIYERPFAKIPYKIEYLAEIENPNYLQVVKYKITEIPFLQPTINYTFNTFEDGRTSVFVEVSVEGSWFFRKILAKKIMAAQKVIIKEQFNFPLDIEE